MESTFDWKPEQTLLEKLVYLARQRGQSPESIVNEAVSLYLKSQEQKTSASLESDPLVGLFASDSVATNSEDLLQQEIIEKSGWTWKESNP